MYELQYEIPVTTYSDAGKYRCIAEGPSGRVQQDFNLIVAENVHVTLDVPGWNASMVRG